MSKIRPLTYALLALIVSLPAYAAETPWVSADSARARLVARDNAAALELDLPAGWHTYWRVPGDAGLPPRFDWSTSDNVKDVVVQYPYPKRMDEQGIVTFGYEGSNIFPLTVAPKDVAKPVTLNLKLDAMVCKDICIPQTLNLSLAMNGPMAGDEAVTLKRAAEKIPANDAAATAAGLIIIDTAIVGPDGIVVTAHSKNYFKDADIFASVGDQAITTKPEITIDAKDAHKAMIKLPKPTDIDNLSKFLSGKTLDIVLVMDGHAAEKGLKF